MYLAALTLAGVLLGQATAFADEGMWLIQDINAALEKKMQERGLKLSAGEIYNADAPGAAVSDAIVSLGFYCTGSIISDQGLLITNHHCAYSDVFALSTPEHNYLEEGYWAVRSDQELPIPDKQVFFLKRVLDITGEVKNLRDDLAKKGLPCGMRRVSHILESKYKKDTGKEAYLNSMWAGEKYYMALYDVYEDLRLVAAPPVSVAAFGGDTDNWEWPQHKCDFAMYRVYMSPDGKPAKYSSDNVPLKPLRKLDISLDGYKPGDYTMVIGYPGRTNRYASSLETDYQERVTLPIANELRRNQMEIMRRWMDADPAVWLKYSDTFFGLSNIGEMQEGEAACLKRFGVKAIKESEEKDLQAWIEADPARKARWGSLMSDLQKMYDETEAVERNKAYFRETFFRGTIIGRTIMRMNSARGKFKPMKKYLMRGVSETDPRVERDLLEYSVSQYFTNIDTSLFGPYQRELSAKFGTDFKAMTDYIWEGTMVASREKAEAFNNPAQFNDDRLKKLLLDVSILDFNKTDDDMNLRNRILALNKEYTQALYEMRNDKGIAQYPDANSTMRITYGTVGPIEPHDGVWCSWQTSTNGIIEKYDAENRDFKPSDAFMSMLESRDWGRWAVKMPSSGKKAAPEPVGSAPAGTMPADFLTDNDITGGNSGSPVLNAEGKVIGLAFDGNKESLASDLYAVPGYNKCVCVDIRYILWTLDKYAGMSRIIEELGL
mgnify:FL=1